MFWLRHCIPNLFSAINICKDRTITGDSSGYIYLDSTGAPNYQNVSCTCRLQLSITGTLNIKYRSEGQNNCGIQFRVGNYGWSCEGQITSSIVSQQANNLTYVKTRSDVRDPPACIGFKPGILWKLSYLTTLGLVARKPDFVASEQQRQRPACTSA